MLPPPWPPDAADVCTLMQQAAADLGLACAPRLQASATLAELGLEFHTLVGILMLVEPSVGWLPADLLDHLPPQATVQWVAERVVAAVAPANDPTFGPPRG
ncbi:hypothetical protein [Aquabacterium sp. J223]|uniref:hypothetical protein n=1 Tax=Aquabacterium sp. J223 TaxID=2898431 RepID=UPI0021AD9341|nr:hypothetical protein [Aquabacterium sp. J223]UUX96321.1 hypothetical protein LRS07_03075 [Aquabacterium sp. J223]